MRAARECYHCRQWVEEGEPHDCWTTTEAALTAELSEDLQEAWERLRETATGSGDQRVYASHKSIMFSRSSCYTAPRKRLCRRCGAGGPGRHTRHAGIFEGLLQTSRRPLRGRHLGA